MLYLLNGTNVFWNKISKNVKCINSANDHNFNYSHMFINKIFHLLKFGHTYKGTGNLCYLCHCNHKYNSMGLITSIISPSDDTIVRIRSYCFSWKITLLVLSKTLSKWAWIVWGSLAWPRISNKAGSDTKKNRGNFRRFFSRYLEKWYWKSINDFMLM